MERMSLSRIFRQPHWFTWERKYVPWASYWPFLSVEQLSVENRSWAPPERTSRLMSDDCENQSMRHKELSAKVPSQYLEKVNITHKWSNDLAFPLMQYNKQFCTWACSWKAKQMLNTWCLCTKEALIHDCCLQVPRTTHPGVNEVVNNLLHGPLLSKRELRSVGWVRGQCSKLSTCFFLFRNQWYSCWKKCLSVLQRSLGG